MYKLRIKGVSYELLAIIIVALLQIMKIKSLSALYTSFFFSFLFFLQTTGRKAIVLWNSFLTSHAGSKSKCFLITRLVLHFIGTKHSS